VGGGVEDEPRVGVVRAKARHCRDSVSSICTWPVVQQGAEEGGVATADAPTRARATHTERSPMPGACAPRSTQRCVVRAPHLPCPPSPVRTVTSAEPPRTPFPLLCAHARAVGRPLPGKACSSPPVCRCRHQVFHRRASGSSRPRWIGRPVSMSPHRPCSRQLNARPPFSCTRARSSRHERRVGACLARVVHGATLVVFFLWPLRHAPL